MPSMSQDQRSPGRPASGMQRQRYYLPQRHIDALAALAREAGIPAAEMLRRIIDKYLSDIGYVGPTVSLPASTVGGPKRSKPAKGKS